MSNDDIPELEPFINPEGEQSIHDEEPAEGFDEFMSGIGEKTAAEESKILRRGGSLSGHGGRGSGFIYGTFAQLALYCGVFACGFAVVVIPILTLNDISKLSQMPAFIRENTSIALLAIVRAWQWILSFAGMIVFLRCADMQRR